MRASQNDYGKQVGSKQRGRHGSNSNRNVQNGYSKRAECTTENAIHSHASNAKCSHKNNGSNDSKDTEKEQCNCNKADEIRELKMRNNNRILQCNRNASNNVQVQSEQNGDRSMQVSKRDKMETAPGNAMAMQTMQ